MRTLELALHGGGRVLLAGLVFGAGLPVVYALAMRALTIGAEVTVDDHGRRRIAPSPLGRALSGLLIVVLIGAVVLGITLIVASGFGKAVSFENGIPVIVDKT